MAGDNINNWQTALIGGAVAIVLFVAAQFGCNREETQAMRDANLVEYQKKKVSELLKNPSSAQFRNVSAASTESGGRVVCGEVSGKNSFGAYTGFQRFVSAGDFSVIESEVTSDTMDSVWMKSCQ